jgi:hypothetical protein
MTFTADGLGTAFQIALLLVAIMLIQYLLWAGKRLDPLCMAALLAVEIGLRQSGRAVKAPGAELLWDAATGVALFAIAVIAWQLGLRRLRNAG